MSSKSRIQILVKSITPVVGFAERADWGRYVTLVPISDIVGPNSIGVTAEFVDMKGATVSGTIVDVRERVKERKFPDVSGIVLDTKGETTVEERKRMAQGGIQRVQQRTPAPVKTNKRAQP